MKVIDGTIIFKLSLYFIIVVKLNLELQQQMELNYFDPEYWGNSSLRNVCSTNSVKSYIVITWTFFSLKTWKGIYFLMYTYLMSSSVGVDISLFTSSFADGAIRF